MAIHKGTWWDAKRKTYVGQVDYGTALIEAEEDLATEVLVLLVSGGFWSLEASSRLLPTEQKFSRHSDSPD